MASTCVEGETAKNMTVKEIHGGVTWLFLFIPRCIPLLYMKEEVLQK
jgi:hypothetical protein